MKIGFPVYYLGNHKPNKLVKTLRYFEKRYTKITSKINPVNPFVCKVPTSWGDYEVEVVLMDREDAPEPALIVREVPRNVN